MDIDEQADKIIEMIIKHAKSDFPDYTDKQILIFTLNVIQHSISRLEKLPKQLNLDF